MVIGNCTDPVSNCLYNLSKIVEGDLIVTDTATWVSVFDSVAGGFVTVGLLAFFGIALFIITRRLEMVQNDSEALVYSSLITTVLGVLLFLIPTANGAKLLIWSRLLPFVIILLVSVFVDFLNRRYS